MKNVPLVLDSRLQFAEWFYRVSWLVFGLVYTITLYEHWKICEESYNSQVKDTRMEQQPSSYWRHLCDCNISSDKENQEKLIVVQGHLLFSDSPIKKIISQLRRHEKEV